MHLEIKVHRLWSAVILSGPERGCHRSALKSGLPHGFFQGIISMSLGWQDMKLRVFLKFSFTPRGVYLLCGNHGKLHPPLPVCSMQDNLLQYLNSPDLF